jgi:nucleotide-binding universal stress UspA family protein
MQILVAQVDFSELSELVVRHAGQLARAFDAELLLLHVAADQPEVDDPRAPAWQQEARLARREEDQRMLDALKGTLGDKQIRCKAKVVEGRVVETILDQTPDSSDCWLVVGSHGRSAMYKSLVGSVTDAILRAARCPVVVIPPQAILSNGEQGESHS